MLCLIDPDDRSRENPMPRIVYVLGTAMLLVVPMRSPSWHCRSL